MGSLQILILGSDFMKIVIIIIGIIFIVIFLLFLECSLILAKREDEYMEKCLNLKKQ